MLASMIHDEFTEGISNRFTAKLGLGRRSEGRESANNGSGEEFHFQVITSTFGKDKENDDDDGRDGIGIVNSLKDEKVIIMKIFGYG